VATQGVEGIVIETHNWGKTVAFWQALGYQLVFETDHHSGQLEAEQGPYLFVAEKPESQPLAPITLQLRVPDASAFELPANVEAVGGDFEPTHWNTLLRTVNDPDDRPIELQAPVKD
jgi:hypothetical protein